MQTLLQRAEARWCRFSDTWDGYDYMKFLGGTVWIPQYQDLNFMFNTDTYWLGAQFNPTSDNKAKEESWIHPGYMLHAPNTHLILSRRLAHHTRWYKLKIKVPTTWESYAPIKGAMTWVLWFWFWTWWDPERAFFDPCKDQPTGSCEAEPWWGQGNDLQSWVNRAQYQQGSTGNSKNWGPFLPSRQCSGNSTSFWFIYKLKFKLGGESLWTPVPRDPQIQGYIPTAPGLNGRAQGEIQPYTGATDRVPRPRTPHDIFPFDLEDGFLLSDEALERITGGDPEGRDPPPIKRQRLDRRQRPPRHISRRARRIILQLLRGGDPISQTMP